MLTLQWPLVLLALPLPYLVYRFAPVIKRQESKVFAPSLMILAEEREQKTVPSRKILLALAAVAWCALVLSASRPIYVGELESITSSDRNMMLAVDISKSMLEEDMEMNRRMVNRLQAVKNVVADFVSERQGDRLGLILFGEQAYIQTPLTFDLGTLKKLLDEAVVGLAGGRTAIGDAIGLAVKRLQNLPESNRVVILLTDGQNTAGEIEPLQAAKLAAQAGVKIYTVGIGADEMIVQGFFGPQRVNPSRDLDEKTLTAISHSTGGQYYRARNLADLANIYAELDQLEAIEIEEQKVRPEKALYPYPLGFAFLLLTLIVAIKQPSIQAHLLQNLFSRRTDKSNS